MKRWYRVSKRPVEVPEIPKPVIDAILLSVRNRFSFCAYCEKQIGITADVVNAGGNVGVAHFSCFEEEDKKDEAGDAEWNYWEKLFSEKVYDHQDKEKPRKKAA